MIEPRESPEAPARTKRPVLKKRPMREDRVDLRVPAYVKQRIRTAADLTGRSISDFIISAALEEAEHVTETVERWKLNEEQSALVLQLMANPQENPALEAFLKKWQPSEGKAATTAGA
jgi:uncharacterized protein (DUF1778 family)